MTYTETKELLRGLGLSENASQTWADSLTRDFREPAEAEVRALPGKLAKVQKALAEQRRNALPLPLYNPRLGDYD